MADPVSTTPTADPVAGQADSRAMRSVVLKGFGVQTGLPWWWKEIQRDRGLCELSVRHITFRNKRSSREITVLELPFFLLSMLPVYLELRRKYDYVYTFECSLTTFGLAFWQTLLFSRRPRHVVLQFIMREKTRSLASRLKYLMMKWCFSSIHMAVCSASAEAQYYREVFNWPAGKAAFVPYHTSGDIVPDQPPRDEGFVFAAGRTLRDFPTLIAAVAGTEHQTLIVSSRSVAAVPEGVTNIRVLEEIPLPEFSRLIAGARVVVVPLHDRKISTGQIVVLHAMALGKPVIATRTSGTIDYITHGQNGWLVEPNDPAAMRRAIDQLMADESLRTRLGNAARQTVVRNHLPHHYTQQIRAVVLDRAT